MSEWAELQHLRVTLEATREKVARLSARSARYEGLLREALDILVVNAPTLADEIEAALAEEQER